ncbi:YHYH domain-containing protein [Paenibacillus thalictri]|uniref:YHYH domain-containing protein n=1 Tax=Paenibacillus thalictri TaxID=2527873 RepID=A0A4Q9DL85_9BACL|nr:YHYH domain-containing protein [Paenibacillus thalictri]TBL75731.1 YHYH domain-containing protein [Paenibacillus thalictri]
MLKKAVLVVGLLCLPLSSIADAHPGRTDANGGHTCRTNCEKWGLKYGEYHYHNGGSTSGSTSGSGSKASPSSIQTDLSPKEKIPEGTVKVKLPSYKIFINKQQVLNASSKYPIFEYKDITYIPMTWNYTQALGIENKWDPEIGLIIRKTDNKAAKLNADPGIPASQLYAKLPDFNVFINDAWVDNSQEEYPILVLNDITYFPLTWQYAVEELGLTTKLDNDSFYISK